MHRCQFFALPSSRDSAIGDENGVPVYSPALVKTLSKAARCVFAELTTPLGRRADHLRGGGEVSGESAAVQTRKHMPDGKQGSLYQVVGQYRLLWPKRQLLEHAAA